MLTKAFKSVQIILFKVEIIFYVTFQGAAAFGESDEGAGGVALDGDALGTVDAAGVRSAASLFAHDARTAGRSLGNCPRPQHDQSLAWIRSRTFHLFTFSF